MGKTPTAPVATNIDDVQAPSLGTETTDQTVGRSYKRLKLAEVANQLQRATSADLGKEVRHHHSVVAAAKSSNDGGGDDDDTRPGWVDGFKKEFKEEFKDPILMRFAKEANHRTRSDNKTMAEKGLPVALLEVAQIGGPVEVGQTPTLEDLGLDDDFFLTRDNIMALTAQQMDAIYNVYREPAFRDCTIVDRCTAFWCFLCDM